MKPLFIAIKKDNRIAVAVNSQDLKVVHIGEMKDGRAQAKIQLSGEEIGTPLTQHAVDKMRHELKERYNIVHIDTFGIKCQRSRDHKNDLLEVKIHGRGVYYVFPKAVRQVQANGTQLHIDAFGQVLRVNMTNRPDTSVLEMLACSVEET